MRVAIIGAGALGTLFGGLIAHQGHEVWLIHHSPDYVQGIEANGVEIVDAAGSGSQEYCGEPAIVTAINATTDSSEVGGVDVALVLVKSHHTREALTSHRACIQPSTAVLSLQNGLRNREHLENALQRDQVLTGVTYTGAEVKEPGTVQYESRGKTIFGGGRADHRSAAESLFREAGFSVRVVKDPTPYIWQKALWSLALGPLSTLTRLELCDMYRTSGLRQTMELAIGEAIDVARAVGIELSLEPNDVLTDMQTKLDQWKRGNGKPSMLVDVERQRKTEIDEINGTIVEFGEEVHVDTPVNRVLTELVRGLESSYLD